jgi:RHS repeat-associated protein
VPGGFDVMGIAHAGASVTVNSSPADYRRGEYFQEALSVVNTAVPVWQNVAVTASQSGSSSNWPAGSVFVPRTGELFGHDTDGNLTSDGRWAYTWDGENRLVRMVANTAVGPQQRLDFEYDWQGRRIRKVVWPNTGGTGTPTANLLFVYDGWNLVAELNATNKAVIRSYVWGLDLSGSEQGAGGVGGLLAVKPGNGVAQFAAYDGNGNVTALVDGTTGTYTARYEYGPFGEPVRVSGTHGSGNPFRFSTKFTDDETGLVMYLHRPYNPSTGRFLSKDPIGDVAFLQQYARGETRAELVSLREKFYFAGYVFARNNPLTWIDLHGLEEVNLYVTSVIRPPNRQAGVKTTHLVVVNEYGQIVHTSNTTGFTDVFGFPLQGDSKFWESMSGTHPKFTVYMRGDASSATLPSVFDIDYKFNIQLDFCSRKGRLYGRHDGYPSYTVRVKGQIYDWQQQTLWSLIGEGEINVDVEFSF